VNRILVVDDEPDLRITYERLLRRSGYRVVTAGSQHEGLSLVMAEPPRLVISDLRLPDGNGIEIVQAARALDPPVPVIVVTAFASQALRESARALGASALLTKPFAASELLRLVHAELSPPER
jgi:DNA-binding response OmpR family regulator